MNDLRTARNVGTRNLAAYELLKSAATATAKDASGRVQAQDHTE